MHRLVSIKASIDNLHIPLKSRLGFTQNDGKTSPALVTTQIRIVASILIHFETHVGSKVPSPIEFWEPLNEDNDSDIIIALQNWWFLFFFFSITTGNTKINTSIPSVRRFVSIAGFSVMTTTRNSRWSNTEHRKSHRFLYANLRRSILYFACRRLFCIRLSLFTVCRRRVDCGIRSSSSYLSILYFACRRIFCIRLSLFTACTRRVDCGIRTCGGPLLPPDTP